MQRRMLSVLAALAAALPLATQAGTMDYSFVELGFLDTEKEIGSTEIDGDGFALRGSLAVNENFFVFAGYQDLSLDFGVDATTFHVGGGGHWPLTNKIDIVGRVGIVKAEYEIGNNDQDEDGFLLGARLRTELAPRFEIEGGFEHTDLDDIGDDTSVVLEGRYFFIDQLAGGVLVEFGDSTTIGIGARLTF